MPTYDYRCDACGYTFELFQGMKDSVKRTCPECKARKLKRLIGIGAAVLIGGNSSAPEPKAESSKESQGDTKQPESTAQSSDAKSTGDEKKMSGSTSTPTHQAREHRGIGNLVDAAKRTRENSKNNKNSSDSSAVSTSQKSEKKPTKKPPKVKKSSSKKTSKSNRSRSPRKGK